MPRFRSITVRLLALLGAVGAVMGTAILSGYLVLSEIRRTVADAADDVSESLVQGRATEALSELRRTLQTLSNRPGSLSGYFALRNVLFETLDEPEGQERPWAQALRGALEASFDAHEELVAAAASGDDAAVRVQALILEEQLAESEVALRQTSKSSVVATITRLHDVRTAISRPILIVSVAASVALLGMLALFYWSIRSWVLQPLHALDLTISKVVQDGDLTQAVSLDSVDEIGRVANSFDAMIGYLRTALSQIDETSKELERVAGRLRQSTSYVRYGSEEIDSRADGAARSLGRTIDRLAVGEERFGRFAEATQVSASANAELTERVSQVAIQSETLSDFASRTSREMASVAEAAELTSRSSSKLDSAVRTTSTVLGELKSAGERVALETESATSAAQASLAAAGEGTVAAKETLRRLEEIQESSRQAERSYLSLEVQLSEVGQFVDTIEGISRQTNLLSVNAGIIAAQAGEEGRGFAVVADEIRALSGKTSDSTEQIFQLVSRIEEESKTTLAALRVGLDRVSVGIEVGVTAVAAFERIRDSARELDLKIRDVYETSRKSTQTAEAVRLALADVSDVAVELGRSAKQHVNNGEMVRNLAQKTSEITVGVLALVDTQSRESRQVADALEEIAGMSHDLKRDQREQGEQAQAVVDTVMLMQRASAAQGRAVSSLEAVVREVESQASALHRLLSTFRV